MGRVLWGPALPRVWRVAALAAAAATFVFPADARAHDPGLSALDVRVAPDRIVVVLSLATADARIAAADSGGHLDAFAADSIELLLDGVRLSATVESEPRKDTTDGGTSVALVFPRITGTQLTVRSGVPVRLARGHRELLTVRDTSSQPLAERMLDERTDAVDLDLAAEQRATGTAAQFLQLGVTHILGGYDHLLFLGALLLGVRRLRSVVTTVTAFTVAHSLTLSLAVLGLVHVPAALVEPLIAASIVFVGIENLMRGEMASRWKLTFVFGLVHGFGFAGALQELGVGEGGAGVAAPLGWFNAGVEAGQIAVVMLLWPVIRYVNARPILRLRLAPACSVLVIAAGTYWMAERTLF
jgi:hydrogenase/urease accessory protein HupE